MMLGDMRQLSVEVQILFHYRSDFFTRAIAFMLFIKFTLAIMKSTLPP